MHHYEYKNIKINAITIGGIETCYIFPDYNITFDIGKCPEEAIYVDNIFLSHAHLDHASGLPYYLGQRALKKLPQPKVYMHPSLIEPLSKIIKLWHQVEGFEFEFRFIPIEENEKIEIAQNTYVQALPAFHRVPTYGYVIIEERIKLKQEYLSLPGRKIKELKDTKEDIFIKKDIPLVCFSGDTTIEFIQRNALARQAKVILLECTYIDAKRPPKRAHEWGHIHLDDIIQHKDLFQNERLVLVHFSKRYSVRYIKQILKELLAEDFPIPVQFIANNHLYETPEIKLATNKYLIQNKQFKVYGRPQ